MPISHTRSQKQRVLNKIGIKHEPNESKLESRMDEREIPINTSKHQKWNQMIPKKNSKEKNSNIYIYKDGFKK